MTQARTFRELVAERVRSRREKVGLTQDQVARAAWTVGLPSFRRGVIAGIERGTRDLTLPELAALVHVLGTSVQKLFRGGGPVYLDEGVVIETDILLDALFGRRQGQWDFATEPTAAIVRGRHGVVAGFVPEEDRGVAEQKAARKLSVPTETIAATAQKLWGRSLTVERDARVARSVPTGVPPRSLQALRGHVTRQLLTEVAGVLRGGK